MARQQLPPQIKKIYVTNRSTGSTELRYQMTVDAGVADSTGTRASKRTQLRRRFHTEKDARAALSKVLEEVSKGTFVPSSTTTVEEACAEWLAGRRIRESTKAAYTHALQPLRDTYGGLAVQKLTKGHLDALVNDLLAGSSVKPDGQLRRPWKATSINPMLNLVSAVLTGLVREGRLVRDVAALVDRAPRVHVEMQTFTEDEVQRLLEASTADRNGHAWLLALSGLRRGELCGLRWNDVDLYAGRLTINNTRVSVNGRVVEGPPKTEKSKRTLPLTPALKSALETAHRLQGVERKSSSYVGPGTYVVSDAVGRPFHPDTVSDYWRRLCIDSKVSDIRLHDARHTCGTLLHLQGVPIAVISAWLGHSDNAFTMRTYVHSQNQALLGAADTLQSLVRRRDEPSDDAS